MPQPNASSIMASFAILKSLSDEKKYQSPYQILAEFIRYIITADSLYAFSAIEMKNKLNEHFGFSIPEAVVRTSVKKISTVTLENGIYNVLPSEVKTDSLFEEKKAEADENNSNIISLLTEYIKSKNGEINVDVECLTRELVHFLIEDIPSPSSKYAEIIGEFILKNEKNQEIQENLDKIREGSILYIGLNFNIGETGNISKKLTLYLGTEVLFSLVGYNGEIYRQLAADFFEQVQLANSGDCKKIQLHYFSEIKKEVNDFFLTAEQIVEKKRPPLLDKPAMISITNGCSTSSDVAVKQSDFYHKLKYSYGITEDPNENYYDEEYFASNLESFDYVDEDDKKKKKEMGIKLISHINKLRGGKHYCNDIDSEYLLITNTKATLLISKEQAEKVSSQNDLDNICNFAISLDRITSILWYKLGNGFGNRPFPSSVSTILKARVVLSSSIAKNADKAFFDLKKQFESGEITEDQLAARIVTLRNKPKLPEELEEENIDDSMDFSPDFLCRYEEKVKESQRNLYEKEELIKKIKADSDKRLSDKDVTIASQADTIKAKESENIQLRSELDEYHRKDAKQAQKKERRRSWLRFAWSIIWKLLIIAGVAFLAFFCKFKLESELLTYTFATIDAANVAFSLWCILKKDRDKYLSKGLTDLENIKSN